MLQTVVKSNQTLTRAAAHTWASAQCQTRTSRKGEPEMPRWYGGSILNPDELAPPERQWVDQWNRLARWRDRVRELQGKAESQGISYPDVDILIAFFQNCYHLRDWIEASQPSLRPELHSFFQSHFEMRACRDICNGFKHKMLSRPSQDPDFNMYFEYDYFQEPGKSPMRYRIAFADGNDIRKFDAFELVDRCLRLWEDFRSRFLPENDPPGNREAV
jgi:hypothetical protein